MAQARVTLSPDKARILDAGRRAMPARRPATNLRTSVISNQAMIRRLAKDPPSSLGNQADLRRLQAKLRVGAVNDPLEREADAAADRVMGMTEPKVSLSSAPTLSRKCAECEEEEQELQREATSAGMAGAAAPPIVHDVLNSPGRPLDPATHDFMASRFGADFGDVRIHTDSQAAQSAAAVNALAYTVGRDVVFAAGQYNPREPAGMRLIAHELAHVRQQAGGDTPGHLRRFEASEVARIAATPKAMLDQIRLLVDESKSGDYLNWEHFVEISGGTSTTREVDRKLGSKDPTIKSKLLTRYLFTCRCGLVDMRHYLQLLYISDFARSIASSETHGNRIATGKGREHELTAEPRSRFGPEDMPSNALGAATTFRLAGLPTADAVYTAIADTLNNCAPVGWSSLAPVSRDQIVHFYGDAADPTNADSGPKNQNQTAVPDILPIVECQGKERSFPYALDDEDNDRKTLSSNTFIGGSKTQTSASDIRDFVFSQRSEIIRDLPLSEKIRFLNELMSWPIRDVDVDAIKIIYNNSSASELAAEP